MREESTGFFEETDGLKYHKFLVRDSQSTPEFIKHLLSAQSVWGPVWLQECAEENSPPSRNSDSRERCNYKSGPQISGVQADSSKEDLKKPH